MRLSRERLDAEGAPQRGVRPSRNTGVPPEIAASFPSFKFEAAAFKAMRANARANAQSTVAPPVHENHVIVATGTLGRAEPPRGSSSLRTTAGLAEECDAAALVNGKSQMSAAAPGQPLTAADSQCFVDAPPPSAEANGPRDVGRQSDSEDGGDDLNLPQCSVCIGDFEEGEMLRQLPCQHVFHQSCIDPWMASHSTCPNCRQALWTGAEASMSSTPRRPRCGPYLMLCMTSWLRYVAGDVLWS